MEYLGIIIPIVAAIMIIFNMMARPASSRLLQKRFIDFGKFNGRTLDQFKAAVGNPSKTEFLTDSTVCTWATPYYTIVVAFDKDGIFKQKVSEIVK